MSFDVFVSEVVVLYTLDKAEIWAIGPHFHSLVGFYDCNTTGRNRSAVRVVR
jgi:hypothetical protein